MIILNKLNKKADFSVVNNNISLSLEELDRLTFICIKKYTPLNYKRKILNDEDATDFVREYISHATYKWCPNKASKLFSYQMMYGKFAILKWISKRARQRQSKHQFCTLDAIYQKHHKTSCIKSTTDSSQSYLDIYDFIYSISQKLHIKQTHYQIFVLKIMFHYTFQDLADLFKYSKEYMRQVVNSVSKRLSQYIAVHKDQYGY